MNKILSITFSLFILSWLYADSFQYIILDIESGFFNGDPTSPNEYSLAFSVEVGQSDKTELRLYFGDTNLGDNSFVIIRSVYDGIEQTHNTQTLSQPIQSDSND